MKNTNKAFTLVELIVVITILAILGTIAFISLQGYSQDAKNAKVSQDLNTLASAIEVGLTDGKLDGLSNLVEQTTTDGSTFSGSNTLTDGQITIFDSKNNSSTGEIDTSSFISYKVGAVDFAKLRQNGDDFKDPNGKNYIASVAYSGATAYYQLAGEKKEASGEYRAVVKGNYIPQSGDVEGLVATKADTTVAVTNSTSSGSSILY